MPLTLITGPANSEKAGAVLDAYRAAVAREPILVVPTREDVEYYRRELASGGLVLGARVDVFEGLVREAALRCDVAGRPVGPVARRRLIAAAIAGADLEVLAAPSRGPGFARALLEFVASLEAERIDPPRFASALRTWAGSGPRRPYAEEVASLYSGYRRLLERLGRSDAELHARATLDALRLAPDRWRGTPVFFYGFDDLTPLQIDAIDTLARHVDAAITVSLSYEAGRVAFAGRATTFETLRPLADRIVALEPRDDYYEAGSAAALHHLERSLFEESPSRTEAGEAVALLEGGGERAELELVAAEVARLLAAGTAPREIAVAVRSPASIAPLIDAVFDAAGVPYALARELRFADTALGHGIVSLLRFALLEGDAAALVAWLRAPGVVERSGLVDLLEARVRRNGLDAGAAVEFWERIAWPLDAASRLREAAARSRRALLDAVVDELERLFARPRRRAAAVLDSLERNDAAALAAARRTLAELGEMAVIGERLAPSAAELVETLEEIEIVSRPADADEEVLVTDPLALRARRVRTLFACRLQEGVFPRQHRPRPFFSEKDRKEIAAATGLRLPREPEWLDAERYLFYATVSRPTARLVLSWHVSDDDGQPAQRSLFVDDVRDLFDEGLFERRARRAIAAVDAAAGAEPFVEAVSGPAFGPLESETVLGRLRDRGAWSPSSIEAFARCPVRWMVERYLGAEDLEPRPAPIVRGSLVHDVLREVFEQLKTEQGSARVDAGSVGAARALLQVALEQLAPRYPIWVNEDRMRAAVAEVKLDLERYFDQSVRWGGVYEPSSFETEFGWGPGGREENDPDAALVLAGGRVRLHGRIDRVDLDAGSARAIVYDYKGRSVDRPDDWLERRTLQLPLYMLAAEQLLDVEVVGGFYQPIGARVDYRKARGVIADGADDTIETVRGDRRDADDVRELLDAVVALAVEAVEEIERGAVSPRPRTCTPDGVCAHPSICRLEAS